jgi:hypothetical protein
MTPQAPSSRLTIALLAFGGAAWLSAPLWSRPLDPSAYDAGHAQSLEAIQERNSSALAMILGEVRANAADFVFIKTERYLHSGVGYAPHMAGVLNSEMSGDSHDHSHDHGDGHDHDHDHAAPPTMIPSPEKDFRGFIGRLERAVKPWQDPSAPHQHTTGTELLPWYRVMTVTDPHNVRGYMIGAWWLGSEDEPEYWKASIEFITEGTTNNPTAFQLWLMRSRLADRFARFEEPVPGYTDEQLEADSLASLEIGYPHALRARPSNGTESGFWTDYQEADFWALCRTLALKYRDAGRIEDALRIARETQQRFGHDGTMQRLIDTYGTPPG